MNDFLSFDMRMLFPLVGRKKREKTGPLPALISL